MNHAFALRENKPNSKPISKATTVFLELGVLKELKQIQLEIAELASKEQPSKISRDEFFLTDAILSPIIKL